MMQNSASLPTDFDYVLQVTPDGSDQIFVDDQLGELTTVLDVSGAAVTVQPTDLLRDTSVQIFDVDLVTGLEDLTLRLPDANDWDSSELARGIITFRPFCDPNSGGDINGDGDVGFADFIVLADNFGRSVDNHKRGDINCDGEVGFADFIILSQNFGQTIGAEETQTTSVPEPGKGVLAVALALASLMRKRNKPANCR